MVCNNRERGYSVGMGGGVSVLQSSSGGWAVHPALPGAVGRGIPLVHKVNGGFVGGAAWIAGAPAWNPTGITPPAVNPCHRATGLPWAQSPSVPPPAAWAAAEGREWACVLPAPLCPSLAAAWLLQPLAPASSSGLPCAFLFSRKTGLLQCVLCNFAGSYPSHNSKSSKRMRCSNFKQCGTYG